ncbi:MAG: adenosylmethionine--8-amino-7-oxononanoate transaminase [Flavobacteriales bacterium]|nr:adenosylmethionine--8-amino-7-oxononanoate transaminase [Flavobacteriales bacterium]
MNNVELDRKYIWHPFTQMKIQAEILPVKRAAGSRIYLEDGSELLDCISSWWVNVHGHAHPHIAARIGRQAAELEHVIFAGFTHAPATELASRLVPQLPGAMAKIFFSDNGSTSVEVALKMAVQFFSNHGKKKTRILAFENAYHGDTFGAMSVGGRSTFNTPFEDMFFEVDFLPLPQVGDDTALQRLENYLEQHEYAAFIYEPLVQGSAGMVIYDAAGLNEILARCREKNILLIADEVFTGFGRTGTLFASQQLAVKPDMMCISKGLTGGFLPMGITACTQQIFDAFYSDDKMKALYHGHSYTANPIACAAACASLDLFEDPSCFKNIQRIATAHQQFALQITGKVAVRSVKVCGTILSIELETGDQSGYFHSLRDKIYYYFIKKGLLMRPLGNVIYVLPPYCFSDEELKTVYTAIDELVNQPLINLL